MTIVALVSQTSNVIVLNLVNDVELEPDWTFFLVCGKVTQDFSSVLYLKEAARLKMATQTGLKLKHVETILWVPEYLLAALL